MMCRMLSARRFHNRDKHTGWVRAHSAKHGLLVSTSAFALMYTIPGHANDCTYPVPETANCTIAAGTTSGVSIVQWGFATGGSMTLENDAALSQNTDAASYSEYSNSLFLDFFGLNGTTSEGVDADDGPSLTVTNNGDITATGTASQQDTITEITPVDINSTGGSGAEPDDNATGGSGGDGGTVTITNNASIIIDASATQDVDAQLRGIRARSNGGNGGDENPSFVFGDQYGGPAGDGNTVSVTNSASGTISFGSDGAPVSGANLGRAIEAISEGGTGGDDNGPGGQGGSVTITNEGTVNVFYSERATGSSGVAGLYARSEGGSGTASEDDSDNGGAGASSGSVSVSSDGSVRVDTSVTANPIQGESAAILAVSLGGAGGTSSDKSTGGTGGAAGTVTANPSGTIVTNGDGVAGLIARSQGGAGGNGNGNTDSTGGRGGAGGDIQVNLGGSVTTSGDEAYGVMGQSIGALGGGNAGTGGLGGNGGYLGFYSTSGSVTTTGDFASGITLHSVGGGGGTGDNFTGVLAGSGGNGGNGGDAGKVEITSGTAVTTSGDYAAGIIAQSIGGSGGTGGIGAGLFLGLGGDGGAGGSAGEAIVNNTGVIVTEGYGSNGIIVQSLSGGGGVAGVNGGVLSIGGQAGAGSGGERAYATNNGNVTTSGDASVGIAVQSIGGGGGSAAGSAGIFVVGGSGSAGGNGGEVEVYHVGGAINTSGEFSHGITAQSIGGGGGNGGNVFDLSVGNLGRGGVGGSGSVAGDGGSACITNFYDTSFGCSNAPSDDNSKAPVKGLASILTTGDFAVGAMAQSIGGGGGNGGTATGVGLVTVANIQLGASGSAGGNGGETKLSFNGFAVETRGNNATGLLNQSIGGGGGNGGNAVAIDVLSLLPVQVGGNSGVGGSGGNATTSLKDTFVATRGANAAAIVNQSIGGGGGTGGSASGYDGSAGISIETAVGGSGGPGGDGGTSEVRLEEAIVIATGINQGANGLVLNASATDSHGVIAQSIGGGGGTGGTATADAFTLAAPTGEDISFAVTISTAVGGSGGVGGNGDYVGVGLTGLNEPSQITTGGDGSFGILAQSIGGGGGDGGGSSSLADTIGDADTISVDVSTSIGGTGGSGGNSDVVIVGIDTGSSVQTYGDHANAIVAQTISGGGGNGGVGSSSSNKIGGGFNATVNIGLGGTGGTSGSNNNATVELDTGSTVFTNGANSHGVVAQAITGGGGTSQGGNIGLSASGETGGDDYDSSDLSASVTVNVGSTGGNSTTAGTAEVTALGWVSTTGGDSDGIVIQSIGGSGGIGGSAGSDAGDNGDGDENEGGFQGGDEDTSYTLTASVGGTGGTGGNGGGAVLSFGGNVTTKGDWADGIVMQSIGGGGGTAGTAVAAGSEATASLDLAVGGTGGTGGNGGEVSVNLTDTAASVATMGYGAHAMLLQSIGGGGGHGADGSDSADAQIAVGGGIGGSGGASGNGGAVSVSGDWLSASTQGDDAFALIAQSIGGGGGTGGAGSSEASNNDDSHSLRLSLGGDGGGSGNGGTVTIDTGVTIKTVGGRAYGILAQSIGGGGGVSGSADGGSISSLALNGTDGTTGNGAEVSVTLDSGSTVTTTGRGAHAIIAQSIGGGGGLMGDISGAFNNGSIGVRDGDGTGGTIYVDVDADITTSGDGAFGILAQSVGGGGGLAGDSNGVYAGSSATSPAGGDGTGSGGAVTVVQSGTISAGGEGSIGIYAQSAGYANTQAINVTTNGTVTGGTGSNGTAVLTSGGTTDNTVEVTEGALVLAGTGGDAIRHETLDDEGVSGESTLLVDNSGVIDGSIRLHADGDPVAGLIQNNTGGTLRGATVYTGTLTNSGTVEIGDRGNKGTTRLSGDFTQSENGILQVGVDFSGARSDLFSIEGNASFSGQLSVDAGTLAPNVELEVVNVVGALNGSLEAADTAAVDYSLRTEGGSVKVSVADTRFESAFSVFNRNQRNMGAHLDAIFDAGSGPYGGLLADLDRLSKSDTSGQSFAKALSALAPGGSQAAAAAQAQLASGRLGKVLSCPVFAGDTAILEEEACIWSKVGAAAVTQGGSPGYDGNVYGLAAGAQFEVRPDWFVGFAAGYENASYDSNDGLSNVEGDTGFVAAALKRQWEGWLLAGAVSAGYGTFNTTRLIDLPSFRGTANGDMDVTTVAGRIRAAYTFGNETGYVRPFVDLDVINTYTSGYDEHGAGIYNLRVDSESQTTFVATPALELGARLALQEGWVARGFVRGGVSFSSEDNWTTSAALIEAPVGSGTFEGSLALADVVGRVATGAQFTHTSGFDLTAEYEGAFGNDYSSHSGALKFSFRF
ncbi:autotransporter outer membrane beta-barrel domain-containing protein [Roseibium aggregatum]|uniref:autotransporter outer membrane beta-barrel domain-containing protein n=1 Tax=Roseibium aggregatum TaxID=187304 RepID=UPI0025AB87C0|nr:autotransporter outer membrane beta-barrel domain-containing protein [Roseibium aggregatum]WJS05674.1 autotransporter outer membrane beta-barrel domain-containing protein [Roseibium aggregatum]